MLSIQVFNGIVGRFRWRICSNISFGSLLMLLLAGCGYGDSTDKTTALNSDTPLVITPSKPVKLDEFDYALPQSNYSVKVKISGITTKIKKDAFLTKADQYAVAKKVNGRLLRVSFTISNPYDHELMIPVPDYFYITSENGEWFSSSTTRHKACHCEIDNSTEVRDINGKALYMLSEGKCGYDNYCIKFQAKETKVYRIDFTDAILGSIKNIVFNGFNLGWDNPNYTVKQDKGLIIDLETRKIIGEKRF